MKGDVKRVIFQETGLEPIKQRLLFRGKEKEDDECLQIAGVKNNSKLLLIEDSASKEEMKIEEIKESSASSKGCAGVRFEIDKLAEQVYIYIYIYGYSAIQLLGDLSSCIFILGGCFEYCCVR